MNNENKVRALLASGKSSEDIVKFLVMNDDYRTGPEARTALETFMNDAGLVPHKKVPMSEQYMAWYKALSRQNKLAQTKESLHTQAVAIGMSAKSADWYARVYLLAGSLALEMSMPSEELKDSYMPDPHNLAPEWVTTEMSAPATTLEEYLAELHDAEYEALSISKRKAFDKKATARYHALGGVL
jgi:hypothetical protein